MQTSAALKVVFPCRVVKNVFRVIAPGNWTQNINPIIQVDE
jgi:hypothetical protein